MFLRENNMYSRFLKRFLDILFSALAIILLSPLFLLISLFVFIFLGRPILFSQRRIGKNTECFNLVKFRTMTNKKDSSGNFLPEEQRLTKFGIFLRSLSFDELPELFLILIGKMSFIGPRPQPTYYGPYYTEKEFKIFSVRGGLIPPDCLCKIPDCGWEEQFKWELFYTENITFLTDLKIFFCSFLIILKRLRTNYGKDERPKLNVYRKNMNPSKEKIEYWSKK